MEQTLELIDERQAAQRLKVSVAALRRWRREKRGPPFTRIERCVRYDSRLLLAYLDKNSAQ
ncbi:MAG TPA: helix-turn-helix domain-containing protein [Candidatus Dormibacteraeota bacterium]|jgi:hypothetical protein|nr:helix-turn-helix domain-containing protein [Candidatus Dormibacteraeota bacterium]